MNPVRMFPHDSFKILFNIIVVNALSTSKWGVGVGGILIFCFVLFRIMWNSILLILSRGHKLHKEVYIEGCNALIVTATSGGGRFGEGVPQQHALWLGSLHSFHSSSRLLHEEHVSNTLTNIYRG
jgi:hypothetical protein